MEKCDGGAVMMMLCVCVCAALLSLFSGYILVGPWTNSTKQKTTDNHIHIHICLLMSSYYYAAFPILRRTLISYVHTRTEQPTLRLPSFLHKPPLVLIVVSPTHPQPPRAMMEEEGDSNNPRAAAGGGGAGGVGEGGAGPGPVPLPLLAETISSTTQSQGEPKRASQRTWVQHWERVERDFFRPVLPTDVEDLRQQVGLCDEERECGWVGVFCLSWCLSLTHTHAYTTAQDGGTVDDGWGGEPLSIHRDGCD